MYIHATKLSEFRNPYYPRWMDFTSNIHDPFYKVFSNIFSNTREALIKIGGGIYNTQFSNVDVKWQSYVYTITDSLNLSGSFYGDSNLITQCISNEDFLSPIPTRLVYQEEISIDNQEDLFSVCYIDNVSGQFHAIGHSGIYLYDLSGALHDSHVYNWGYVKENIDLVDDEYILKFEPASGTLHIYDIYDYDGTSLTEVPSGQFILSGSTLYANYVSGQYFAEYHHLIYEDGAKIKTSNPKWENYKYSNYIFIAPEAGYSMVPVPFTLETGSSYVRLITDCSNIRPGRSATVNFYHDVLSITTWPDYHTDMLISPISGEQILSDSIRAYTTSDTGETPLYLVGDNIYSVSDFGGTAIYPSSINTSIEPFGVRLLSGEYTSGTSYISYYSEYKESYDVSGEQSYLPSDTLTVPLYENHYVIEDSYLYPKTVFTVQEPRTHIRSQMNYVNQERFELYTQESYGGICKRFHTQDVWICSDQLNSYQNKIEGDTVYFNTSQYDVDYTYRFADALVDETWDKCYVSGDTCSYSYIPGGSVQYAKQYNLMNFYSDPFKMIGFISIEKYLLYVLYKNDTIILVYYNPDTPLIIDNPDVVELSHSLTDPKDSFLYNNKLYILDDNKLKVFHLYHDYMISYGTRRIFRELYDTVEVV